MLVFVGLSGAPPEKGAPKTARAGSRGRPGGLLGGWLGGRPGLGGGGYCF